MEGNRPEVEIVAMLVVAGSFVFDAADRDAFIASKVDSMIATRNEGGCLEYCMSADPLDPTRVVLLERWADQASFDAHMAGLATAPRTPSPAPKSLSVELFEISDVKKLA